MVITVSQLFIDTPEQLSQLQQKIRTTPCIGIPLYKSVSLHPIENSLLAIIVYFSDSKHIISFGHHDARQHYTIQVLEEVNPYMMYVPNAKEFLHVCNIPNVINLGAPTFYADMLAHVQFDISLGYDDMEVIPITRILDFVDPYADHELNIPRSDAASSFERDAFPNQRTIPVYQYIEAAGLKIDPIIFHEHFSPKHMTLRNDFVYSQYNIYNMTGRATNSFGGINFLAINKSDESRKAFVSRFDNGVLISIDYESFHLRLIADMMGYPQPTIPFHTYLAQQYFNTASPTQEQYDEGKQITFTLMYGNQTITEIQFFNSLSKHKMKLWETYNAHDIVFPASEKTLSAGQQIEAAGVKADMNPNKLFNYYVQSIEAHYSIGAIYEVMQYMIQHKLQSKIILHAYDSILIDFTINDGKRALNDIVDIFSKKYPVRTHYGINYHELKEFQT